MHIDVQNVYQLVSKQNRSNLIIRTICRESLRRVCVCPMRDFLTTAQRVYPAMPLFQQVRMRTQLRYKTVGTSSCKQTQPERGRHNLWHLYQLQVIIFHTAQSVLIDLLPSYWSQSNMAYRRMYLSIRNCFEETSCVQKICRFKGESCYKETDTEIDNILILV